MPEESSDAGYLVFGSSPEADVAARYASSLGATHALTAAYLGDACVRSAACLVRLNATNLAGQDPVHRANGFAEHTAQVVSRLNDR